MLVEGVPEAPIDETSFFCHSILLKHQTGPPSMGTLKGTPHAIWWIHIG